MTRVISGFLALLVLGTGREAAGSSVTQQGIAEFNAGHYSTALRLLREASQDSSDNDARAFLALTEAALGDCKSAAPQLAAESKNADSKLGRLVSLAAAKCDILAGDLVGAAALLEDLQRHSSSDPDVLYLLAKLHIKGFNDAAYAMFQRTPASYRVHQLSAEIFETQNRFSDAATEYRKAIQLNPQAPELHFRLGRVILLESHTPEALEQAAVLFEEELKISPEDAACEFQLGQIARAQANPQVAQSHYERAASMAPTFVEPMVALGRIYVGNKQYSTAITVLKRATELQPDNEPAHYALLTAYRDSGDFENAKKESAVLAKLQKPPAGEFSDFLKRLGESQPQQ